MTENKVTKTIYVRDNVALERKTNELISKGYSIVEAIDSEGVRKVYLNRSTMQALTELRLSRK